MSDSENDLLQNNFSSVSQIISAKGPHINKTFTNRDFAGFRNNKVSSTMLKNIERSRIGEPRGGSPMSMSCVCSSGSTTSLRAVDIAMAFKGGQFNKYDLRIIQEAYRNLMKQKMRRKVVKKRKKRFRSDRRNSDDSGAHGSDSSISSDDWKSLKTTSLRDNISSCRSTRTDISNLRNTIRDSSIYRDCTNTLKQNKLKNILSTDTRSVDGVYNRTTQNGFREPQVRAPRSVCSDVITRKPSMPVLRDRFKNSFLLPSQRFNKSVAVMTIPENTSRDSCNKLSDQQKNTIQQNKAKQTGSLQSKQFMSYQTDSDDDENMFAQIASNKKNQSNNRKRSWDGDETNPTNKKRTRGADESKTRPNKSNNDFNFIKPSLPIKKPLNGKTNEIIVARSAPPINFKSPGNIAETSMVSPEQQEQPSNISQNETTTDKQVETSQNSWNDISMRPSFMKRKLFSQKLDVTEAKNNTDSSSESPQVDSYKNLLREKNKARKLVINNSCLNRDISNVDNNLIDLIHKIVPAEHMNMTNIANQTSKNETKNTTDPQDKWDITSAISTCNDKDNVSDTFTDDELNCFNKGTSTKNEKCKGKENTKPIQNNKINCKKNIVTPCKVVLKQIPEIRQKKLVEEKKISFSCVDNFFETDYETDSESRKKEKPNNSKPSCTDNIVTKVTVNKNTENIRNCGPIKSHTGLSVRYHQLASGEPQQTSRPNELAALPAKGNNKKDISQTAASKELKSLTIKVNDTEQNLGGNSNSRNIMTKKLTNSQQKELNKEQKNKNFTTVSDENKAVEISKIDKNGKIQTEVTSKEKNTQGIEKPTKTNKTKRNKNVIEKVKLQKEYDKNKRFAPQNKIEIGEAKEKSNADGKIEKVNKNSSTKNVEKNNPDLSKGSVFNNSRSRRIRTPISQKENIPNRNIQTRSANKTNKKAVTNNKATTVNHVLQDSFEVSSNNAKKTKNNSSDPDTSNTSMILRSCSLKENEVIVKIKKNGQKPQNNGDIKRQKPKKSTNPPITKIEAKRQTSCNSSMTLRVRKNTKKEISYVW